MNPDDSQNPASTVEADAANAADPSQDLVKAELEKEQRKGDKTEAEKAAYSLKKNADRARELGLDPAAILGVQSQTPSEDDEAPVTMGMLRKMEADRAQKSALQLADEIPNEHERDLAKHYLSTRIVPSGDAQADLRMAQSLVNGVKNTQIIEEQSRKVVASPGTGSGAPAHTAAGEFIPTAEEAAYMRPPFSMTKEAILAARPKQ